MQTQLIDKRTGVVGLLDVEIKSGESVTLTNGRQATVTRATQAGGDLIVAEIDIQPDDDENLRLALVGYAGGSTQIDGAVDAREVAAIRRVLKLDQPAGDQVAATQALVDLFPNIKRVAEQFAESDREAAANAVVDLVTRNGTRLGQCTYASLPKSGESIDVGGTRRKVLSVDRQTGLGSSAGWTAVVDGDEPQRQSAAELSQRTETAASRSAGGPPASRVPAPQICAVAIPSRATQETAAVYIRFQTPTGKTILPERPWTGGQPPSPGLILVTQDGRFQVAAYPPELDMIEQTSGLVWRITVIVEPVAQAGATAPVTSPPLRATLPAR